LFPHATVNGDEQCQQREHRGGRHHRIVYYAAHTMSPLATDPFDTRHTDPGDLAIAVPRGARQYGPFLRVFTRVFRFVTHHASRKLIRGLRNSRPHVVPGSRESTTATRTLGAAN
jgi:hypothetical protein